MSAPLDRPEFDDRLAGRVVQNEILQRCVIPAKAGIQGPASAAKSGSRFRRHDTDVSESSPILDESRLAGRVLQRRLIGAPALFRQGRLPQPHARPACVGHIYRLASTIAKSKTRKSTIITRITVCEFFRGGRCLGVKSQLFTQPSLSSASSRLAAVLGYELDAGRFEDLANHHEVKRCSRAFASPVAADSSSHTFTRAASFRRDQPANSRPALT